MEQCAGELWSGQIGSARVAAVVLEFHRNVWIAVVVQDHCVDLGPGNVRMWVLEGQSIETDPVLEDLAEDDVTEEILAERARRFESTPENLGRSPQRFRDRYYQSHVLRFDELDRVLGGLVLVGQEVGEPAL